MEQFKFKCMGMQLEDLLLTLVLVVSDLRDIHKEYAVMEFGQECLLLVKLQVSANYQSVQ